MAQDQIYPNAQTRQTIVTGVWQKLNMFLPDRGGFVGQIMVRSTNTTKAADGGNFQILPNQPDAATALANAANAYLVDGGPGTDYVAPAHAWNLWVLGVNVGDVIETTTRW